MRPVRERTPSLPYGGGVHALSGTVAQGPDGFFNGGSIRVTPAGIG